MTSTRDPARGWYNSSGSGGHLTCWPPHGPHDPGDAAVLLATAMTGLPFSSEPDLVPLGPLAIDRRTFDELALAARRMTALVERVCWSLTEDPRELARLTGMQAHQVPFLGAGGDADERRFSACNVRPDVVMVDGTARFLECNFGAANSGPITSHVLNAAFSSLYGTLPAPSPGHAAGMLEARADFYRRVCDDRGSAHRVALLGTVRETDLKDVRYLEVEPTYLRSIGIDSAFVEPEQLAEATRRWGVVQKHFLPEEWIRLGVPLEPVRDAHRHSAFFVSDSGLSLSSKLVLAWLSTGTVPLSSDEQAFVARHIPWTRELAAGPVVHDGHEHELLELALRHRRQLVLKPANGCGGRGVVVGRSVGPTEWEVCLEQALAAEPHVLQEHVEPDPATMTYWDRRSEQVREIDVDYVLGPYVVDGTSASCTVRHAPRVADGVVNHARGAALNTVVPFGPVALHGR